MDASYGKYWFLLETFVSSTLETFQLQNVNTISQRKQALVQIKLKTQCFKIYLWKHSINPQVALVPKLPLGKCQFRRKLFDCVIYKISSGIQCSDWILSYHHLYKACFTHASKLHKMSLHKCYQLLVSMNSFDKNNSCDVWVIVVKLYIQLCKKSCLMVLRQ